MEKNQISSGKDGVMDNNKENESNMCNEIEGNKLVVGGSVPISEKNMEVDDVVGSFQIPCEETRSDLNVGEARRNSEIEVYPGPNMVSLSCVRALFQNPSPNSIKSPDNSKFNVEPNQDLMNKKDDSVVFKPSPKPVKIPEINIETDLPNSDSSQPVSFNINKAHMDPSFTIPGLAPYSPALVKSNTPLLEFSTIPSPSTKMGRKSSKVLSLKPSHS
ncbi:hypothetical protein FRX31_008972 [Thalictrum thalictroides]|uniref:Uncharacterized protein n=1 Tax=Thalictrum thalictroides TaxID=46969 RepID=A0A7J6WVL5_THATH|nr:hypothetical protein FRX31_008972 [Thalictrum thalictroides]